MTLSAVLAVRNEEPMLERGLELLRFCDEIVVVVDSRSGDRTEEIARRHTDRVWVEDFRDFAALKNAAIERATGDWVLMVDADERVTPALAREIQAMLAGDPEEWAFAIEIVELLPRPAHGPRGLAAGPRSPGPPGAFALGRRDPRASRDPAGAD